MRWSHAVLVAVLVVLAVPGAASAATVSINGDRVFISDTQPDANEISVAATPNEYVIDEAGFGDLDAVAPCTGGTEPAGEPQTVVCPRTAPSATGEKLEARMGNGNGSQLQRVIVGDGVGDAELWGGDGRDELIGGAGNDFLYGDGENDSLSGGGGRDELFGVAGDDALNGEGDPDQLIGGLGADLIVDTGTSDGDIASYNANQDAGRTEGVDVTLDLLPNDGSPQDGTDDNVKDGIESIAGTDFADVLEGDGAANRLSGFGGDDVLIGNKGADTFTGHAGADTLDAEDGVADAAIDCNNSDTSRNSRPNTAIVDRGLDEAVITDCSTIDLRGTAPGGATTGGGTTGGSTTGGDTGGAATGRPATGVVTPPAPFALAAIASTATVSRMPNVVGVKAATARERVLTALASADIDVDFRRGCREEQDTEIVRQSPLRGTAIANTVRDPVEVKLVMCLADRDFLRDCDLTDLRADVRQLRGKTDAEFLAAVLDGVARCKVDYDVRMAKAAAEAEIALAVQKAQSASKRTKKGEIRAAIDCPSSPAQTDLRVLPLDGYPAGRLNTSFGLRASGPDGWTLPAGKQSAVTLIGFERGIRFLQDPKTYVDADDVTSKGNTRRSQVITWQNGRGNFTLTPEKPGVIRLCTVLETGGDEVLTHALELRVVAKPATGSRWETVGGRVIEVTAQGGKWLTTAELGAGAPRARAAFLDKVWDTLVGLFDGRSRSINQVVAQPSAPKRQRVEAVYTQAKVTMGQLTLDGKLVSDPEPPVVRDGPCFVTAPDGKVVLGTCKQLQAAQGSTALFGTTLSGAPIVAAGAGNIVAAGAGNIVAAGAGNLIGADGATLIGADGASLIGADGASLIGADGASIVAAGAGNIVAAGAGNIVAAGGGNGIAVAPAQIVAAGGGNIVAAGAGNIVAAGGLN